jgi:hypothetical protein
MDLIKTENELIVQPEQLSRELDIPKFFELTVME